MPTIKSEKANRKEIDSNLPSQKCVYAKEINLPMIEVVRPKGRFKGFFLTLCAPAVYRLMPVILPTDAGEVRKLAKQWKKANPGRNPQQLPRSTRMTDKTAWAAFYMSVPVKQESLAQMLHGCDVCGLPTTSWCEGCYARIPDDGLARMPSAVSADNAFSPICRQCDQEKRVCRFCDQNGLTFDEGRTKYLQSHGNEDEGCVEVTGWTDSSGSLQPDGPSRVSLEEVARRCNVSVEEVRRQLESFMRLGCSIFHAHYGILLEWPPMMNFLHPQSLMRSVSGQEVVAQ